MSFEVENKKQKEKRTSSFLSFDKSSRIFATGETISTTQYNLCIGIYISLGFVINFIMAYFCKDMILNIHPIAIVIAYFILTLGGSIVTHRSTSPVVSTIAFFVMATGMGLVLTYFLTKYEVSTVVTAFAITAGIAVVMTILATIFPQFFMSIGKGLLISLLVAIVAEIICALFLRQYFGIFDYIIILIFCGYIGFDVARAQTFAKTMQNAIMSAADLYIDLVNILIRVLSIIGDAKS